MKSYVFPGNISSDILKIGFEQVPYMRTEAFSTVVKECERLFLQYINCINGRILFYTASGTGAMDAVISNYVSRQHAFVIAGGSFGYRWRDLCDYNHCIYDLYEVPFAKDINYIDLEEQISLSKPDVLLCQHHETSSGLLFDLSKIAAICKKHSVSLVVDVISSFLADPLDMDALGIDICLTSSQKGLNIPPGLSFVVLSSKLKDFMFSHGSFYFDFQENLKNLERGQTPYSPATVLFLQLHKRLQNISLMGGVNNVIQSVREKALFFREFCIEYNWLIPAERLSNSITGFYINSNGDKLFKELLKQDIYIMPGSKANFFRVSHLGCCDKEDIKELVSKIHEIETFKF